MTAEHKQKLDVLLNEMREQGSEHNFELVTRAFELCVTAHEGQKRVSHEDYYNHPYSVARLITSYGMDSESVAAALLHDVVEDTPITLSQIEEDFGSEVALIVDGVTKLGRVSFVSKEEQQAENLRKMLIAMAKDIRVIIIKLADRLHNMRTLDSLPDEKQRYKSLETLEIYAPIAHRLGIRALKEELEDLAIKHLDPIAYGEIEELLVHRQPQREAFLSNIKERISERLKEYNPNFEFQISGRVKSIHGIYRKMYVQGKDFDEIYDIYAVRIITDTVVNCYNMLGLMHDMFRPLPGRFKDYISMPKPNMYQSLHTTVIGRDEIPFEIQIRTWDMHHTAEYGIAAHWKYKEGINTTDKQMEDRLAWIRQILDSQNETDASDLVRSVKVDLSQEDVFAVTPKGDVINLPVGSTVIDFAFAIHSAVGIRMTGAKADGKIVPLNHEVKTGEVIEILTTNQAGRGPSRDWINIAVTNQAKTKIRQWFKKERREENILTGRSELERELRRCAINLADEEMNEFLLDIAAKQRCANLDEFYAAIGYGGILLSRIMPRIKEEYTKLVKASKPAAPEAFITEKKHKSHDGIIIDGLDDCLIKMSRCCAPLPGDDIIGFITRGHGVSVHKRDCNNVPVDLSLAEEPERWVTAHWATEASESLVSTLQISGIDRDGMVLDVTTMLYNMRVGIHSLNARSLKKGGCVISVTVSAENVAHLKNIIAHLQKIPGVICVERGKQ